MSDVIARALLWVLRVLLPARGRHAAGLEASRRQAEPVPLSPWAVPWTTPTPPHIVERYTPLRGEDLALVRPYVLRGREGVRQRERRTAVVLATLGEDYPYTYEGAPFPRAAFVGAEVAA